MEIGNKIKLLRLKNGLTQEELADRCELTKGYISQLENDLTSPSITTLDDIVTALGIKLKDLFNDETAEQVVFGDKDYFKKESPNLQLTWLVTNSQKNEMEPILLELEPSGITDIDRPHEGEEFGYVVDGKASLIIGDNTYQLKKGDTFYFKSDKVHFIKNDAKKSVKIIWVSSPPNF